MNDLQSLASISALIMREIDPRLLQRVGPADARIDPKPDFISNSEHAIFMHCIKHQMRPCGMINTEIGSIMAQPHEATVAAMEAERARREGGEG
ncbi:MAG: hypothetical protein ACR2RF_03630 [Geminicoccaceae bacterium]